jgi:hypothetical protein
MLSLTRDQVQITTALYETTANTLLCGKQHYPDIKSCRQRQQSCFHVPTLLHK